jgi:hypothetical protein
VGGWDSLQEGITATRTWAHPKRKRLDEFLGVKNRFDEDHPEVKARQSMTQEEEANYVANRYWRITKKETDTTTINNNNNNDNKAPEK